MDQRREFSAPGRIEIGGNHTDHQHGRVLAAAVDLETRCAARANGTNVIRVSSEGFSPAAIDIGDLEARESEKGGMAALVRGVAAWFANSGYSIGGFDCAVTSSIPVGAGLSSSAAFEVLTGNVLKGLFNLDVSLLDIATAGQYAENFYFGKPCGLMDQAASSIGGLMLIDFLDPARPTVTKIKSDLDGYAVCVTDTGGSHANLTRDYAAITEEMKAIAGYFGKNFLREVDPAEFHANMAALRRFGDRAVLRAFHFFEENERAARQAEFLVKGDTEGFLKLVRESGRSSAGFLQNTYSLSAPLEQGIMLGLAVSERVLGGLGACRVHGGGFAGTVLAFIPDHLKEAYKREMTAVFGEGACHFLNFSYHGGIEICQGLSD